MFGRWVGMPIIGSNLGASVAGSASAERVQARKPSRTDAARGKVRAPDKDELILGADEVEAPEAVRDLKGNEQEESHDDHRRAAYDVHGRQEREAEKPRLDVAG